MKVALGTTLRESEIADEVMTWEDEDGSEDKRKKKQYVPNIKLSVLGSHLHNLIIFDNLLDNEIQLH